MYSDIFDQIQTIDDLSLLKSEITSLKQSLFNSKQGFDVVLNTKVRRRMRQRMSKVLMDSGLNNQKFIEGLEAQVKLVVPIKTTLAFEPNAQEFSTIYQWFLDNVGKNVVLDVYYNPNILGGVRVSYQGKYFDGSLLTKVNKVIESRSKNKNTKASVIPAKAGI